MKFLIKIIVAAALIAAVVLGVTMWRARNASGTNTVRATRIADIRQMVNLCTLEFIDEVALKDSINGKWIFAKCRLNGRVGFDLEQLRFDERGDTLVVTLPPEVVTVTESTAPGSYEVLDTWDNTLLGLGKLSAAEENALRRRQAARYRTLVYTRGYVRRARATAVATLTSLFRLLPGPVLISDPYPEGASLTPAHD